MLALTVKAARELARDGIAVLPSVVGTEMMPELAHDERHGRDCPRNSPAAALVSPMKSACLSAFCARTHPRA
jgi:hypothetical protein